MIVKGSTNDFFNRQLILLIIYYSLLTVTTTINHLVSDSIAE